MKDSKTIHCDVCDDKVVEAEWESHIKTDTHKEKALTQIMEDRIGKERLADTRDETTEFLEELEQDYADNNKDP